MMQKVIASFCRHDKEAIVIIWLKSVCLFAIQAICTTILAAERPNIVVMIADDLSYRDISVNGAKDIFTSNMERLAAAGMSFDRAYVTSPSCAPSRASLLTGLMPARNGAEPNHSKPRADTKKLPEYLQTLDYEVVAFGKVAHYRHTPFYGFDHFAHDGFHEDVAIDNAVKWLRNRKSDKPLCLFVGTNWPHVPWPAEAKGYDPTKVMIPANHVDTPETRIARAKYCTAVTLADTDLGKVYDAAIDVLGSDTFFLFTTDHGSQWPFGKWNCNDDGIHVPMIASWPGHITAGARSDAMVNWADILPTLVDVAGGDPPTDIDGRSFHQVLCGVTDHHHDRIFTTHSGDPDKNIYPIRSVLEGDWLYIQNLHPEFEYTTHIDLGKDVDGADYFASWVRAAKSNSKAGQVVKRYHERPAEELYHLKADPWQQQNVAADPTNAEKVKDLRGKLAAWMHSQRDTQKVYGQPKMIDKPSSR